MSQQITLLSLSVTATAAVVANQFINAAGATPAAAASALGVTNTKADAGDLVSVSTLGTAVVTAGAAIAQDAIVEVGADGKAITKAAGIGVGRALQAATGDGDLIEIFLIPNG